MDYTSLITSQYSNSSKFVAMLTVMLDMLQPAIDCANSFDSIFKLDTAVGDQLDKCGQLVDLQRELPLMNEDIPSVLEDENFRKIIQSRIQSNHWDGTLAGYEAIIAKMLPASAFAIVDNQDMSISVVVIDPTLSKETIALLFEGYIVPKPSGVQINWSVQEKALFGWDSDTSFVSGWESGIWAND